MLTRVVRSSAAGRFYPSGPVRHAGACPVGGSPAVWGVVSTPGLALISTLLIPALSACGGSPARPTDGYSLSAPVTLTLRGRVVDDLNRPIPDVTVAVHPRQTDLREPPQATTDGNGVFDFAAVVRTASADIRVTMRRDGYENVETWVLTGVSATHILYPKATLRVGSTLLTQVVARTSYACGWEEYDCRRIEIEPADALVEVEILAAEGAQVGLTDDEQPLPPFDYQRAVSVVDGDVFVIGGPATVTLRARWPDLPADPLFGRYSLTLTHGCAAVPEGARTRTYTAIVEPAASGSVVSLSDAQFLTGGLCTSTASGLGCHQFLASREHDYVRFDLINADEWHGGYITERTPDGSWLRVIGSAVGRLESGRISAAGTGIVWYCPTNPEFPFLCAAPAFCESVDLRLSFVRR